MLLTHPLSVVTPTVDGDVLEVLARADSAFTPGQLHRLIGAHSASGVRKSLLRLVSEGIVSVDTVGNAHTYRLNRDHLAAPAIIELAGLRATFLERIREAMEGWPTPPAFAALFGSAARGEMHPGSDIDVFVVRPERLDTGPDEDWEAWHRDTDRLQRDATAWTGNDTRILEMSENEVRAGLRSGDPVLAAIRSEGLLLHGPSTFWRRMSRA